MWIVNVGEGCMISSGWLGWFVRIRLGLVEVAPGAIRLAPILGVFTCVRLALDFIAQVFTVCIAIAFLL